MRRVWARCDTSNAASWRIMERLGMRREATFRQDVTCRDGWRDSYLYAMLAEDWPPRSIIETVMPRLDRGIHGSGTMPMSLDRPIKSGDGYP